MKLEGAGPWFAFPLGLLVVGFVAVFTTACPPPLVLPPPPPVVVVEVVVPADHVKDRHGAMHLPGLKRPEGVCDPCHGTDLRGTPRARSCYACHGRKWARD